MFPINENKSKSREREWGTIASQNGGCLNQIFLVAKGIDNCGKKMGMKRSHERVKIDVRKMKVKMNLREEVEGAKFNVALGGVVARRNRVESRNKGDEKLKNESEEETVCAAYTNKTRGARLRIRLREREPQT